MCGFVAMLLTVCQLANCIYGPSAYIFDPASPPARCELFLPKTGDGILAEGGPLIGARKVAAGQLEVAKQYHVSP